MRKIYCRGACITKHIQEFSKSMTNLSNLIAPKGQSSTGNGPEQPTGPSGSGTGSSSFSGSYTHTDQSSTDTGSGKLFHCIFITCEMHNILYCHWQRQEALVVNTRVENTFLFQSKAKIQTWRQSTVHTVPATIQVIKSSFRIDNSASTGEKKQRN